MSSELFLILAYMIIWAGLFGYVLYGVRQQQVLAGKVQILEELLAEREGNND